MSQANGASPANERERPENEVSWRDDPSLQSWSRSGSGGRRPLPVGVPSAVAGLLADDVAVVLVDGRQLVIPIPRGVALASGYTVLDPDPALLRAAGVQVDEPVQVDVMADVEPLNGFGVAVEASPELPDEDIPPLPEWPVLEESPSAVAVSAAELPGLVPPVDGPDAQPAATPIAEAPDPAVPVWTLPDDQLSHDLFTGDLFAGDLFADDLFTDDELTDADQLTEDQAADSNRDATTDETLSTDPDEWSWPTGVRTVADRTPPPTPEDVASTGGWPDPAAPPRLVIPKTTSAADAPAVDVPTLDAPARDVPAPTPASGPDVASRGIDPWAAPAVAAERPQPVWALPGEEDYALSAEKVLGQALSTESSSPDEPIFPFIETDVAVKMGRTVPTESADGPPAVRQHPVGIPLELLDGTLAQWTGPETWEPVEAPAASLETASPVAVTDLFAELTTVVQPQAPAPAVEAPTHAETAPSAFEPVLRSARLHARSVTRRLRQPAGDVLVLDGVDLEIAPSELVVISGAAGAGTSTLLACLAGIDDADSGDVEVDGRSLARLSDSERAHHRGGAGGFVPQENDLVELFTVGENVELPLLSAGWTTRDAHGEVARVLGVLGLGGHQSSRPGQLSTSERRCALVARAVAGSPTLILADHPTAYLDDDQARRVVGALLECREQGASLVVVSRDPRLVERADRVFLLADGRLSLPGTPGG